MSTQRFLVTITDDEASEEFLNWLLDNYFDDVLVQEIAPAA